MRCREAEGIASGRPLRTQHRFSAWGAALARVVLNTAGNLWASSNDPQHRTKSGGLLFKAAVQSRAIAGLWLFVQPHV
jgi:hypothetical protein